MGFVKNTKYYRGVVYEWNLPTGHTCPYAKDCKVSVGRHTGKFKNESTEYYCYASKSERFPGVRESRWNNFAISKKSNIILEIPKQARHIRIHASGDFFSQEYFNQWLKIASLNPQIEFWACTKSIRFWIKQLKNIPENLTLTASLGGYDDKLALSFLLKNVRVYKSIEDVPYNIPIDTNDDFARSRNIKEFALLDNTKFHKELSLAVMEHNKLAIERFPGV